MDGSGTYLKDLNSELENAQKKLLAIFKLIFKGDEVQSAYLLYNLLAKVHQKSPEGMPMGHFNVNISGLNSIQAKQIQDLLKTVLAIQLNLVITTESLTEMRFQPRKNYDTNQMEPGMLQMLEGTNVVCDETHIKEGKIEKNGISNIKALAELIEDQKVVYDFQYVQQDFSLSASVVILSESRSMFKNAYHVPGKGEGEAMSESMMEEILNDQDLIQQLRKYFLLLTHFSELLL